MRISFIGLGVMGFPMAGHLANEGFDVTVYNRTTTRAETWKNQYKGNSSATIKDAVQYADIIFTCVGNDEDVRSVVYGEEGILAHMQKDSMLVDHTTTSAALAREIYTAAKKQQVAFLDAPVSGGQSGAENGILTVMVGGDEEILAKVTSVMDAYSRNITYMGKIGSGQLTKMVNQICVAGILQGLSEGLVLAEASGLDGKKVIEVISKGAAQSWQMENRGPTMVDRKFDFGFAIKWMCKDLGFCLEEAAQKPIDLPMTSLVNNFYKELHAKGFGKLDTSALILQLEKDDNHANTNRHRL